MWKLWLDPIFLHYLRDWLKFLGYSGILYCLLLKLMDLLTMATPSMQVFIIAIVCWHFQSLGSNQSICSTVEDPVWNPMCSASEFVQRWQHSNSAECIKNQIEETKHLSSGTVGSSYSESTCCYQCWIIARTSKIIFLDWFNSCSMLDSQWRTIETMHWTQSNWDLSVYWLSAMASLPREPQPCRYSFKGNEWSKAVEELIMVEGSHQPQYKMA